MERAHGDFVRGPFDFCRKPLPHFRGGAYRKRYGGDLFGSDSALHQPRDPLHQRKGLARPRAGNDCDDARFACRCR